MLVNYAIISLLYGSIGRTLYFGGGFHKIGGTTRFVDVGDLELADMLFVASAFVVEHL